MHSTPLNAAFHAPIADPGSGIRGELMLRPIKIRHYVALMQSKGFAPERVLADALIEPADLLRDSVLVSLRQCQTVVSNMIALTGNPGLGFEVGRYARMTDLGIAGYAILSSGQLRQAVKLWISYSNALVGMLSTLHLEERPSGRWILTISEVVPTGFFFNFSVEEVLVMILDLGSVLIDEPLRPAWIEFSYPAPSHEELYFRYFKCPIRFNAHHTRVVFDTPTLDRPLRSRDEELNEICLQYCNRVMRQIERGGAVAVRLRNALMRTPGEVPSLNTAASLLAMTPRSLRRHLAKEGTNYNRVINEFRADFAREYLSGSNISHKEVAYLLGFRDTNAFRRAFKSWTGLTVQQFRSMREHPGRSSPSGREQQAADTVA